MDRSKVHKKPLFLRWCLITALTIIALTSVMIVWGDHLSSLGTAPRIAAGVILALFAAMSGYCGWLMWRADALFEVDNLHDPYMKIVQGIRRLEHDSEHVWFSISLLQILGLIGTVVGFLIAMLGGFNNLNSADSNAISNTLEHIAHGSSTALVATLIGIGTSVILGLEHHILIDFLNRHKAE